MTELKTAQGGWRVFRRAFAILISFVVLFVCIAAGFYFLIDRQNEPLCHKAAYFDVLESFDGKKSGDLPNVEGRSVDSLRKFIQNDDAEQWNAKYRYVPGLRRGDPGDLILLYMKQPTRYVWHSNPQTVFRDAKWMILPLDFVDGFGSPSVAVVEREMPHTGEESERVSQQEFKSRLRKTLDFLRNNDRPYWKTVVAENEKFLKSLETE